MTHVKMLVADRLWTVIGTTNLDNRSFEHNDEVNVAIRGFTMLMGEFATAVKYRLPIKVVIIKNNVLGMIKWEQMVFLGNPEYGVSLEPIDFVKFAEACGGIGFRCERPDEVHSALEAMLLADGPALCEAIVDPFEPPMPARIKTDQALHMAEALARGEPNRGRIALTLFRDKITDFKSR
jgi:pyruvate dehydrogenase (quinone)/pyruvate oxidase